MVTVLRQGCVVSAGRSAPQDTPHNNSAELALLYPLTDKKLTQRGDADAAIAVGDCMSQLS